MNAEEKQARAINVKRANTSGYKKMKNTNRISLIMYALCCAALTLAPLAQAQPSALGRILDDDGKPVSNPVIFLLPQQGGPATPQKPDSRADGSWSATGLSDGVYHVCVHMPEKGYINACQWLKSPPTVTVKNGLLPVNVDIPVQTGVKVSLHVNDPGGNLQPKGPVVHPPFLLIGVWSEKGLFQPMTLTAASITGMDYSVTVPYESNLKVTANGTAMGLALEKGASVDASKAGASTPLRVTKGNSGKVLTLDVTAAGK